MITARLFLIITVSYFVLSTNSFSQKQVHIPWPSLADSPWPVTRGDMQGTGRSKFIGPRTNHVEWRKDMPLGILFGPVIGYNDILYTGERSLSADTVNYFYSIDKFGNIIWIFETETYFPNNSAPTILYDSTIYFFSRNENMYSLNYDGSLKWKKNIWANFRRFYAIDKSGIMFVPVVNNILEMILPPFSS